MKSGIIIICLLLTAIPVFGDEKPSLALEVNRDELYLGESFILRVTVSGADRDIEPDMSQIRHCNIEFLGSRDTSRHSVTIINGRLVRESSIGRIISYRLTPLKDGNIQAGPVSLTVAGKTLTEQGPVVSVKDIDTQDMVKINISVSRETALIEEPFDVTLTILIRSLDGEYSDIQPIFPDDPPNIDVPYLDTRPIPGLESPDIRQILNEHVVSQRNKAGIGINNITYRTDPFDFGSLSGLRGFFDAPRKAKFDLNPSLVEKNGQSYVKYSLTVTFIPKEEGDYVFGPALFKGTIPAEVDDTGRARGAEIFAVGHAATVRVTPPPEEGRPLSFSGAIGSDIEASASLDAQECNVGDLLKLTLTILGDIRLEHMLPPRLGLQTDLTERFMIYDGTVETIRDEDSRRYVYTLRPTTPGPQELPPIEISYFNTKNRSYETVRTDPVRLKVHESHEITASKIIGRPDQDTDREKKTEALPAPIITDPAGARPVSLLGNPNMTGMAAGAGPLTYLLVLLGQFITSKSKAWKKFSRHKYAGSRALSKLKTARALAHSDPKRFCAEIRVILRQYLEDRLQYPTAALTPDDVRQKLIDSGVARESAEEFAAIFEHIFNAEFCSNAPDKQAEPADEKLMELILRMERKP